jgi:hypothetical protein
MVLAVPGGRGLFSQLQVSLREPVKGRVKLHTEARDQIENFYDRALDVTQCPTRIAEIVPTAANFVGTVDAAKAGAGGVWFPPECPSSDTPVHPPIAWRHAFPDSIQARIVSYSHPTGDITNSDLELFGVIAHQDVLAQAVDVCEHTLCTGSDNTPAVSWHTRGSTTTVGPASYLLRESSLHQRQFCYQSRVFHIAVKLNVLADVCSCRFDWSDQQLLAYLNSVAPQVEPWQLHRLLPETASMLTSALQRQRPARRSRRSTTVITGMSGVGPGCPSAGTTTSMAIPSSLVSPIMMSLTPSLSTATNCELGDTAVVNSQSVVSTLAPSWRTSQRRSPFWVILTPDICPTATPTVALLT